MLMEVLTYNQIQKNKINIFAGFVFLFLHGAFNYLAIAKVLQFNNILLFFCLTTFAHIFFSLTQIMSS